MVMRRQTNVMMTQRSNVMPTAVVIAPATRTLALVSVRQGYMYIVVCVRVCAAFRNCFIIPPAFVMSLLSSFSVLQIFRQLQRPFS